MSTITESLLEMHYFRVLVRRYKRRLGSNIEIFKPASNSEHWYGFDQAYFTANIPKPKVIDDLKNYVHNGASPRFSTFRAFCLQFKVVEQLVRSSGNKPSGWNVPYFRSELYLKPNATTGLSQHETMRRLSGIPGASVEYVCPMIFDENDIFERPKLSDLRFVDIATSPTGWLTAQRHFIAFQTPTDTPNWCSEPIPGELVTLEQVIERARPLEFQGLTALLDQMRDVLRERVRDVRRRKADSDGANLLPSCLSIVGELNRQPKKI